MATAHIPREAQVLGQITRWLKTQDAFFFKTHGGPYGRAGLPDIIGCRRRYPNGHGHFFAIEVKRPGGRTTALQDATLGVIDIAGGANLVADSLEKVQAWWDTW